MQRKIAEIQVGIRRIAGTDWPVKNVLYQIGDRKWQIVYGLCNGIAETEEIFKTKSEALEVLKRSN